MQLNLLECHHGFQRRCHGLVALVFVGAGQAGTVDALLFGVAGQHTKPDGGFGFYRYLGQAAGGGVADVVKVRGSAADDHAQGDEPIVLLGQGW